MSSGEVLDKNKLQSQTIDALRFPLAVCVVFIHSFGAALPSVGGLWWQNGFDLSDFFRVTFSLVLPQMAVPVFFVISGYLFFCKVDQLTFQVYAQKIKKRFKTLFVPYILWITIALAYVFAVFTVKGNFGGFFDLVREKGLSLYWNCIQWGEDNYNWIGGQKIMTSPYLIPFWFIRDLIVMSLISPLIYVLERKGRVCWLALLSFCYVSGIWVTVPGLTISTVFYFSVGAYFGIYKIAFAEKFWSWNKKGLAVVYVVLLCAEIVFGGTSSNIGGIVYPFFIMSAVVFTIGTFYGIVKHGRLKKIFSNKTIKNSNFFIYATHNIMIVPQCSAVTNKLLILAERGTPTGFAVPSHAAACGCGVRRFVCADA